MRFEIKPISPLNWDDFVLLMQTDAQCSDCWCLNHRAPSGCPTGDAAKEKMKLLVQDGKVHGLIAYLNSESVGWLAIDPMSEMVGHDCQNSGKENEWAIHCLYVKDGFRGIGLSAQLIEAALVYAKDQKAKVVSAFPIPTENREKFPPNEAEFSGRLTTYAKLGFKIDGEASDFYQRVELKI